MLQQNPLDMDMIKFKLILGKKDETLFNDCLTLVFDNSYWKKENFKKKEYITNKTNRKYNYLQKMIIMMITQIGIYQENKNRKKQTNKK